MIEFLSGLTVVLLATAGLGLAAMLGHAVYKLLTCGREVDRILEEEHRRRARRYRQEAQP